MPTTAPIPNPTWYGEIRHMFKDIDIEHMRRQGYDLTDYTSVKNAAPGIYGQVAAGNMPPGNPWAEDMVQTFLNWMTNEYPKGTDVTSTRSIRRLSFTDAAPSRIRKEISKLTQAELITLKKAFEGIRNKSHDDPNSYFAQAGWHGLPNAFCMHHAPGYNPWHRAFLVSFENALRTIPGCENVTLPYWDINTLLPSVFSQSPFDSYTLPIDIGGGYNKGYTTTRYAAAEIRANFTSYKTLECLARAVTKTDWEDYHGFIDARPNNTTIQAHDSGHVSIGDTMAEQAVSAFDPIFWFYHCNLDRLFWQWQTDMEATNLNSLLTTVQSVASRNIFVLPVLQVLPPFTTSPPKLNTVSIIDSVNSLNVGYEVSQTPSTMLAKTTGAMSASDKFFVRAEHVNVRIKGINRLKIPGSFKVHLLKDGKVMESQAFFQPNEVEKCENCVQNPIAHFDFELPLSQVSSGKLSVWVEPVDHSKFGDHFPHKLMGNPTVNVRLLLSNEM